MPNSLQVANSQFLSFEKNMKQVLKNLQAEIEAMLTFDVANGDIIPSDKNFSRALTIQNKLLKAMQESGYNDLIEQSIKDNNKILKAVRDDIKDVLDRKRIVTIDTDVLKSLQKMEGSQMVNVAEKFIAGTDTAVMNNVINGTQLNKLITTVMKQSEKFSGEALLQMDTIKNEYLQYSQNNIAEQIGFGEDKDDIWEYTGSPLQDNSHKECIWALREKTHRPYFTNKQKMDFESGRYPAHLRGRSAIRYRCHLGS